MTAFPDVTVHDLGDDDEFLVIACDGAQSAEQRNDGAQTNFGQVSGIASLHKQSSSSYDEASPQSKSYTLSARI